MLQLPALVRGLCGLPVGSLAPVCSASLQAARSYAIDARHRTLDESHKYLDSLFRLKGSVALVTGAGGGVGHAVCLAMAKRGADIIATDLKEASCSALIKQLRGMGSTAEFMEMDVRDSTAVDDVMKEVEKKFGHLDVLVANAAILGEMKKPHETCEENWHDIFATNVDGVFHTARSAYPLLKRSKHSKVVITSSIAGMYGYGMQSAYCASKGALLPLAKSLAMAWAADGINVNVVLPGAVNIPFAKPVLSSPEKLAYLKQRIPLGRLAETEEIAGPIVFFASPAADYCTGTTLVVDGGGTARAMAQ